MQIIKGEYGEAKVYNDYIEEEAVIQIKNLMDHPVSEKGHVCIMPDVHSGMGCVIGYTARLNDKVVPNLIGVDIGCGVAAWKIGMKNSSQKFDKLDRTIRQHIPSGKEVRRVPSEDMEAVYSNTFRRLKFTDFENSVNEIVTKMKQNKDRVWQSIGSLGGGNHFIEVNLGEDGEYYLVIHSGSRNFGLKIAEYHQGKAVKKHGKMKGLEYLTGDDLREYMEDMRTAQNYALLNRRIMAYEIIRKFYKVNYYDTEVIESVHNYINFDDRIIRKGAISAHANEKVIIPLNMADGSVLGTGKGNETWNCSAPHGAGRKLSRTNAKKNILLEDYVRIMKSRNIWSSSVDKHTLDEAPQAYKKPSDILKYIGDTVVVDEIIKPVYNFKASE